MRPTRLDACPLEPTSVTYMTPDAPCEHAWGVEESRSGRLRGHRCLHQLRDSRLLLRSWRGRERSSRRSDSQERWPRQPTWQQLRGSPGTPTRRTGAASVTDSPRIAHFAQIGRALEGAASHPPRRGPQCVARPTVGGADSLRTKLDSASNGRHRDGRLVLGLERGRSHTCGRDGRLRGLERWLDRAGAARRRGGGVDLLRPNGLGRCVYRLPMPSTLAEAPRSGVASEGSSTTTPTGYAVRKGASR